MAPEHHYDVAGEDVLRATLKQLMEAGVDATQAVTTAFKYNQQLDGVAVIDPMGRNVETYRLDAAGRPVSVTVQS